MWNIEARKAEVERSRRESRGAVGAEGIGCGEGVFPSPLGRGQCPSPDNFLTLDLQMVTFGAFWCLILFSCMFYTQKLVLLGFQNLPLQFTVVFQADDND